MHTPKMHRIANRTAVRALTLPLLMLVSSTCAANSDIEWVQHVLIDVSPSTPNDAARKVAWQLPADTVEWYQGMQANRDDSMRSRGIATSAAEQYEFEESLQFDPSEIFQYFHDDGMAMNETGQPPPGGFGGKPTMTDIAPLWAEQVRQGLLRPALFGDCVTQDNVGAPLYSRVNGGFDNRTSALFAEANGLPPEFDMGKYVQQKRRDLGLGNESCPVPFTPCAAGVALVQDRIVREMIRFHFTAHLRAWNQTRSALKQDAAVAGRPEPAVYGNVHIVENVYSVLVSQYLDVVWTETPAFLPRVGKPTWGSPATGFSALQYKLGRAAGNFSKPHWGIVTLTGCGLAPAGASPQTMTAALAAAEAVANGGVAALAYGDTFGATAPDPCLPSTKAWTEFVDAQRHLFARARRKLADVAILYSVPSRMWIQDTSLAVPYPWANGNASSLPLSDAFAGVARVAEDHHILYDVLIMDHPSVSSFRQLRARLPSFRVVVLPVVQALSDADAAVLATWVRAGGTMVAVDWEQTAMYDEDFVARATAGVPVGGCRCAALQALRVDAGRGEVRVLKDELWNFAYQGFHDTVDDAAIAAALTPPTQHQVYPPIISAPGLPATVWANVWIHGSGPMRSVALVNYNGNATTNTLVPVNSAFTLNLRCDDRDPAVVPVARARAQAQSEASTPLSCKDIVNATITNAAGPGSAAWLRADVNIGTVPLNLSRSSVDGVTVLSVTVPAGTIRSELSVIAFSAAGEWSVRAAAAAARKWAERLRIAQRSWRLGAPADVRSRYDPVLEAATAAIDALEKGPLTADAMAGGNARMVSLARALQAEVTNITQFVAAASASARADALAAASNAAQAISVTGGGNWRPLRADTMFNSSTGYGWLSEAGRGTVEGDGTDRHLVVSPEASLALLGDPLHGGYVGGTAPSTLRLDLPAAVVDGDAGAVVTLITGSFDTGRMAVSTAIQVRGATTTTLPADMDVSGRFRHIVFRITAAECRVNQSLYITLSSPVHGHFFGDDYGQGLHTTAWLLNGVLVTANASRPAPTAAGRSFDSLAKALAATALTRWWFVGPFYDPHFTARMRIVGPEAGAQVDLNASYEDGFGNNASWRVLSIAGSTDVPKAIKMPPDAAARAANKTVVAFLCTRVFVPSLPGAMGGGTLLAQLTGSTSSLAALRVNGVELAPDQVITGRSLREFTRPVTLLRGKCNEIFLKVSQPSWASAWEMSLSLGTPQGASGESTGLPIPIKGLRQC